MTRASSGETTLFSFQTTLTGNGIAAASYHSGSGLPAIGSEIAVINWDGTPGSTQVNWGTVTSYRSSIDGVAYLVHDVNGIPGRSGGGVFWNGMHVANIYGTATYPDGSSVNWAALNVYPTAR